ncbi:MAG: hypothetical protein ABIT08_11580 [Bacteroidia bacterium]
MKLKFSIIIFFLFSSHYLFADTLTLLNKIDAQVSFFTTDLLGNSYIVTENGLFKYDLNGKLLFSFSQKTFGTIQFVDATDPLKVLLFNKDFSNAIILDKNFAVQATYNLRNLNLQQPVLICISRHNGYWIYDKQTNQLKKFDNAFQPVRESSDLSLLINAEINPVFLVESEKWLWMSNPASGVLIFDMFGTYLKTLEIKDASDLENIQVNDDKIILSHGNTLKETNQSDLKSTEITYPELKDALKIRIEQNRLYVLEKDAFEIYSF